MHVFQESHLAGSRHFGSMTVARQQVGRKSRRAAALRLRAAGALRVWLLGVFCFFPCTLLAQGNEDENAPLVVAEEPVAAPAATESDAAEPGEAGKQAGPGLLLSGKELERYLEWRNGRSSPDYSITSIDLKGSAEDDERALLTATIAIQINRDDVPLRIPLNLNEATLTGQTYEGSGTATPDDDFQREAGYHWWLRGKGRHVLTLSLIVPVKKQLPARRLQLTVPATAVSRLEMKVPLERLSAKVTPKEAWVKTAAAEESETNLEVQWFGRRLDLSWEPVSQQGPVETVLLSHTAVSVSLTGESVVLEATQQIQALQGTGTFSTVSVSLPPDFALLYVEGKTYSDHRVETGNQATVTLAEPTESAELKWTLEAPLPGSGGKLTLEGFEVGRARQQRGELAISGLDGFQMTRRDEESRWVDKVNASDAANGTEAISAYGFRRQPFKLVLDVQEIEPGFTVKPKLRLQISPERAQLDARFTFEVYRGAVPEVAIHWPQAAEQGWVIETIGPPDLLNRDRAVARLDAGLLKIPLLRRKKGEFELQLKASRQITAGKDLPLSLPYVEAPSQPTILELFSAENVEVELSRTGMRATPLPAQNSPRPENLPDNLRSLLRATYRVDAPEAELTSKVVVHERKVSTRTTAHVELEGKKLHVTQRVTYNVEFERLAQVLLLVPSELEKQVQFTLGDDVRLTPSSTLLDEGPFQEMRLALPEPRIDEFEIVARFTIDLPALPAPVTAESVTLPLLQSSDHQPSSTRLEWRHGGSIDVAPVDEQAWEAQSSLQNSSAWLAEGAPQSVALRLSESARKPAQEFNVRRALIRTVVESNGIARSKAQFRIDGAVSAVVLAFPPDKIVLEGAWWGSRPLSRDEIVEIAPQDGRYRFEVADTPQTGERLLTVNFRSARGVPLEWSRLHRLAAPEFGSDVWIEESIWQVSLPGNQLLFTQPADYTPRFRWQRSGLLWSRQPLPSNEPLDEWIGAKLPSPNPLPQGEGGANAGPADDFHVEPGNSYRFSRFGPAATISYRTMGLPFVVFLGAGLSLAAGFMLLYVPLTRNVLTFLLIGFAVSAIALWYPAPVELLLQPAVLGLLLAIAAAVIDGALRREKRVPVLTLSSPSEFNARLSTLSSVESTPVRGAGSEDPTAVRPSASGHRELAVAPESGSHL